MDRKSIIIIAVSFIVLMLWYPLVVNKLYPPKPLPPHATNLPPAAVVGTNLPVLEAAPATPAAAPAPLPGVNLNTNLPEELVEFTTASAHYTFTSRGGGLKLIELFDEPEGKGRHQGAGTNAVVTLNTFTPAPTLALLGPEAIQGDSLYHVSQTNGVVIAEKDLPGGLVIRKTFEFDTNYLLKATVRLENRSAQPLNLPAHEWYVGTATPSDAQDKGMAVGFLWYNGAKTEEISEGWFANRTLGCIPGTPRAEYRAGTDNVVWAAVHDQFFALALMPDKPAPSLVAHKIDLPHSMWGTNQPAVTNAAPQPGYTVALNYPALTLKPGDHLERQFHLFAGPKEYQTLVRLGDRFNNNLDLLMGYSGFFGFFAKALLLAMNWVHSAVGFSYGWAIVVITIIIKLIFWPLTQASTRSAKRMAALQPQMKAIQAKYKDDPMKANRKTMEFMRENKVSPLGGCLPMIIQIPVFFGFYRMIQSAIELRHARFLWIHDLAKPDTLFVIPGLSFIPFLGVPGVGLPFNLLPLIMGVTMLWQAHLTPPSPGMDPTQAKIMKYMPLFFMLFLYNFSAGLTLYWTVQNLLTIAQTKLTRMTPATAPAPAPVLTPAPKKRK